MLRETTAQELRDWEVLEAIDPWGQRRDDHRVALLSSIVAGAAGAKKSNGEVFTADDLLLRFEPEEVPEQTPEQIAAAFRHIVSANNARFARKDKQQRESRRVRSSTRSTSASRRKRG